MKKYISLLIVSIFAGLVFWSCGDDDSSTEPGTTTLTCKITSPLDTTGFFAGDTVRVTVDAQDTDGIISEVRFLLDDNGFSSDKEFPYTAKIPTNLLVVGSHTITAVAENDKGKEVESKIYFGIKPKSPTNLNITQLNVYTFSLAWADNSTGEDGFKIERKIDTEAYKQIATTTAKTFIDSTLNKKGYSKVYYQVRAYKEIYNSNYVSNSATVGFPAPSNFKITPTSVTSAQLTWNDNSTGEDKFEIERRLYTGTDADYLKIAEVIGSNIATKSYDDTNLDPFLGYNYRIKAVKGDNTTAYTSLSNYIPFKTPSNLNATQTSITSASLTWTDNSIGEDKFEIERKLSSETTYVKVGEVSGSDVAAKTWSDTTLEPLKIYDFRVRAVKDSSNTGYLTKTAYFNPFPAPTNLTITQANITSATLTWSDNSIGETRFEIERKLSAETTYSKIGEVSGNDTASKSYSDTTLEPNLTYDFRVKAVKELNPSEYIEKTNYLNLFDSPSDLIAMTASETSIKLEWTDNSNGEEGFMIDRKIESTGSWVTDYANVGNNVQTYTNTGLTSGTTYYYRVRAYYSTYYSSYSIEDNAIPRLEFIEIPTGSFSMGYSHIVNITRPYCLGEYELTQKEWQYVMGSNPSSNYGIGNNYPVYSLNWYITLVYCNKRSIAEGLTPCYTINGSTDPAAWGSIPTNLNTLWDAVTCNFDAKGYRLPTEAEWEYAARYNDGRSYPWGSISPTIYRCNYNYNVSSNVEVGSYPTGNSNLGLCDMAGNVREWVWDWYATYPSDTQTDPSGPTTVQTHRIMRGGGWSDRETYINCVYRSYISPYNKGAYYGLRLAKTK